MSSQAALPCISPATGEQFDQVPITTPSEVVQAHRELRAALPAWSQKPVSERGRILGRFQAVLVDSLDQITAMIKIV